jgi:hypothetical protein
MHSKAFVLIGIVALLSGASACDDSGTALQGDGGPPGDGAAAAGNGQGKAGNNAYTGSNTGGNAGTSVGGGGQGGGGQGGAGTPPGTPTYCPVQPSQCSNGLDDDGDGKVDAEDPECSGPCDNDESSFATGIPGDNIDDLASCRQDCFFDGDSGDEDGKDCQWDLRCDPIRVGLAGRCNYSPMSPAVMCPVQQTADCYRVCRAITPNGCDCFGCCTAPGANFSVRLVESCTAGAINDPQKCPRCTPSPSCVNTCDRCELCFGKNTVEADCHSTPSDPMEPYQPPAPACQQGLISCGPGGQVATNGCPSPTYCVTGCCVQIID